MLPFRNIAGLVFAAHLDRPPPVDDKIPGGGCLHFVAVGELIVEESLASTSRIHTPTGQNGGEIGVFKIRKRRPR